MWLLEIVILFGSAFCFVVSNYETTHSNYEDPNPEKEDCSSNHDSDCFCYDGPGDHQEYSICVDQPESISPCLSDRRTPHQGPGYLMVGPLNYTKQLGQRCFYFDRAVSSYAVARERCKSTFNGKGRMYEPRSFGKSEFLSELPIIYGWWIGVKDNNEDGKYTFDSDGSPIPFTPIWIHENFHKYCVSIYPYRDWHKDSCYNSHQFGTLCEYGG